MKLDKYDSLGHMIQTLIPEYKGSGWRPFCVTFPWNERDANFIWAVSKKRCERRIESYVDPAEIDRGAETFRFGVGKPGHGYRGKRGDFCLLAGHLINSHLTVFYRRLELLGGLHFDLAIFDLLGAHRGGLKRISIMAVEAKVFALRGNSNEKLYMRLRQHYGF